MAQTKYSLRSLVLILSTSLLAVSCGGGGGDNSAGNPVSPSSQNGTQQEAGAPTATGNTASDGFAWINYRRAGAGLTTLALSSEIARAAQNHSDYQRINGPFSEEGSSGSSPITHSETIGMPGYTGASACPDRIAATGFAFNSQDGYGCGEVISAMSVSSGFTAAEELIAAIYHRFIIFQPSFREAGAGSAQSSDGRYTIFTQNFAVRGSFAGLGNGNVAVYPYSGQTLVPTSFDHSTELPDPLPPAMFPEYVNVSVGYPVSVHTDLDQRIAVTRFTLRRQSDATLLSTRLLSAATDAETQPFSAAIVPFQQLSPNTAYVAEFSGTVSCDQSYRVEPCPPPTAVNRTWTFTTR